MIFFRKRLVFHLHKIDIKICFFLLLLILHCNDFILLFNSLYCLKTLKFFIHSDFQRRISWCHFAEICSQEENPGSNMSPREVEKNTGISRTSVRLMIKRRRLKQFKRLKTTMMSSGTQE